MLVWTILIAISAALIGFIFHPAWEQKDSDFIENILHNTGSTTSSHKDIILSIIIPAYNEELRIRSMMDETIEYLEVWKSKDSTIERKYEIFIIDDGSTDNTISEVTNIQTQYHKVPISLVKLKRNQGKGAAVSHGVLQSNGDYVLMVDADGATDIKDLETLFSTMKQIEKANPDTLNVEGVVIGSRAHMSDKSISTRSFIRTVLMKAFHIAVMLLCTQKIRDTQCGFKLFSRQSAKTIFSHIHLKRWAFDIEAIYIAEAMHYPIAEVGVNWHEVEGSKLIKTKFDIVKTSAIMARDLLCNRLCYGLGVWKLPLS